MGTVSTTNYIEAKETGKVYLDKEFFTQIKNIKVVKITRCEECRAIIKQANPFIKRFNKKLFCDKWCLDEYTKNSIVSRKCKKCGDDVEQYLSFRPLISGEMKLQKTGTYPKYCSNCRKRVNKKYEKKEI